MKVHYSIDQYKAEVPLALSIGSFDGVHLAHRIIINKVISRSKAIGGEAAVLTFAPHPRITLNKDPDKLRLLSTIDEKILQLAKAKVDHLFLLKFDEAFSRLSKEDFVKQYLFEKLRIRSIIVGHDHRYGKDREGDFNYLETSGKEMGFESVRIEQQELDDISISSTKIRNALSDGDLELANKLLGYDYIISGSIYRGDGIGRNLGYPTANVKIPDPYKLVPAHGVYAALTELDGDMFESMAYIGKRPSLEKNDLRIEVNILDFDREIYGKSVRVHMLRRTRGDMQFDNLDELVNQIRSDEREIRVFFDQRN